MSLHEMVQTGRDPDAFILVLSVTFPALLIASGAVVEERRIGTLPRVARSPTSLASFIVSKTLAAAGLLLLQSVVILGATRLFVPTAAGAGSVELVALLFLAGLAAHALGLFVSAASGSEAQASQLAALMLLLMLTLSGFLERLDDLGTIGAIARWSPVALGYAGVQSAVERTAAHGEMLALPVVTLGFLIATALLAAVRARFAK